MSAAKIPISLRSDFSRCTLDINGVEEEWLIATSNETPIPTCHDMTAVELKLRPQSAMKVQLAIQVTLKDAKEPESYLFSTLRLPKTTSLPFHLHCRFAISSNRQSIVFDPVDSRNNRDSKTSFNVWILEQLVPPLYLAALEHLLHLSSDSSSRRFDNKHWWLSGSSDEISSVVGNAFRRLLPEVDNLLFKSADDRWISFRDAVFSGEETRRVRDILLQLKANRFVSSYRHSELSEIPSAKLVGTDFVKRVLLNPATLALFQNLYDEKKISATDIRSILEYVAKDPPLTGLPLLILSTGKLAEIPGADMSTVYVASDPSHAALFSSSLFLGPDYSTEAIGHLQTDSSISVVALSNKNITTLITAEISRFNVDNERNAWLNLLWERYSSLPTPSNLQFLEDSSLKIVKTSSENLSLPECLTTRVIYDTATLKKEGLASITKELGIDVLELDSKSIIGTYLSKRFSDKLIVNFLLCLQKKLITSFDALIPTDRDRLANWLRQNIHQNLPDWRRKDPGIQKAFLLQLPLWEIYRDRRKQRLSASGVTVLPSNLNAENAENIIYYMKPMQSIASYSLQLVGFLEHCQNLKHRKFKCMTAGDIMNAVSLPAKPTDFTRLKPFFRSMFQLPVAELKQAKIKLPVSDGTLRNVDELYDHTVDLFEKTLKYTQQPSFIHQPIRDLSLSTLRYLGMTHSIDINSFKFCASEIQRLSDRSQPEDGGTWPDQQELFEMSQAAFRVYQDELPRQIMTNKALWARLDKISFIRPKDVRRQGVSYDWQRYFDPPFPVVLAPSRFVRPNLEPIAWTQRHLCFHELADAVLAVNINFGVPHVFEVVRPSAFICPQKDLE